MFDLKRFRRLASVYWAERGREHLWFLGICVALHICAWLLVSGAGKKPYHYWQSSADGIYSFGLFVTALLFTGLHFAPLFRRGSALTWLMRPASTLEKFALAFLTVAVLYPLAYTLVFQIWHIPAALMAQATIPPGQGHLWEAPELLFLPFITTESRTDDASFFLILNALQALVAAGMLRFGNLAWLKTLLFLFLFTLVALPLLSVLTQSDLSLLLPSGTLAEEASVLRLWRWVLWIGVPGLFWASACFYLRDRELH